jgi:hypothetical protein
LLPAWTLVAGLLVLAVAGSAAAFSQPRAGTSARTVSSAQIPIVFYVATSARNAHTCQKTSPHRQSVRRGKLINIACEQPPYLNFAPGSTLTKAAAIDSLG